MSIWSKWLGWGEPGSGSKKTELALKKEKKRNIFIY
jgi:hypothetical protein